MKLVTFSFGESKDTGIGVVLNDHVLDLTLASKNVIPQDMLKFIEGGDKFFNLARDIVKKPEKSFQYSLKDVRIKAPILNPPSIRDFFAFEEHAKAGAKRRGEDLRNEWYEVPAYYKGNHREIYGPDEEIPWPHYTNKLDFECEIACVVWKKGKNITIEEADNYIFGYMLFNDFSARDIQKKEMLLRMGPAKSKDFANAFGPYLVTKDEVDPVKDFSMTVKVNDQIWSTGHFKNQYWGFPLLISHVSQGETIYPGDILGSGTFYKGCGLDLDRWIKPQDKIELVVPKLGVLKNTIGKPKTFKELTYKKTERVLK